MLSDAINVIYRYDNIELLLIDIKARFVALSIMNFLQSISFSIKLSINTFSLCNLDCASILSKSYSASACSTIVLSITCTSDKIEPYELKVKVTKEDDIIPQADSKGDPVKEKPVDGSRPIIEQIDKPSIVVPPIKMKQDGLIEYDRYSITILKDVRGE